MSTVQPYRQPHSFMPDFTELLNALTPITGWRAMFDSHLIRVEDEISDERYLLRAELPGIDPEKDVQISVQDGHLTIKAERGEQHVGKARSEFSYGSFVRTVTLPEGAKEDQIEAGYAKGILTVSVPLGEPAPEPRKIQVNTTD